MRLSNRGLAHYVRDLRRGRARSSGVPSGAQVALMPHSSAWAADRSPRLTTNALLAMPATALQYAKVGILPFASWPGGCGEASERGHLELQLRAIRS